jgi:hypothetical protein
VIVADQPLLEPNHLADRIRHIVTIWETLIHGTWEPRVARRLADTVGELAHLTHAFGFTTLRADFGHLEQLLQPHTRAAVSPSNGDIAFVSHTLAAICTTIVMVNGAGLARATAVGTSHGANCANCPLTKVCPHRHEVFVD